MRHSTLALLLTTLTLSACAATAPADPPPADAAEFTFNTGTSFGMCAGYCLQEVTMTFAETTARRASSPGMQDRFPNQAETLPTPPGVWAGLEEAADDIALLRTLPDTVGCPDCADGGAEWVQITDGTGTKRVTFEFGKDVPEIRTLIAQARAARAAVLPAAFPGE